MRKESATWACCCLVGTDRFEDPEQNAHELLSWVVFEMPRPKSPVESSPLGPWECQVGAVVRSRELISVTCQPARASNGLSAAGGFDER